MKYIDNAQVKKEYKKLSIDEDITLTAIAKELGLTRQQFNSRFNAEKLAFSELQKWLEVLGYELHFEFIKKENK